MATATHQLRASYAFMERNANLVKRYWSWELVWLAYSIANALSVSFIGLGMEAIERRSRPTSTAATWPSISSSAPWSGTFSRSSSTGSPT